MKLAFRWKIALAFTLLAAAVLGALGLYLHSRVSRHTTETIRQGLLWQARLVAEALADSRHDTAATGSHADHLERRVLTVVATPLSDAEQGIFGAVGLVHDATDAPLTERSRRDRPGTAPHSEVG